MLAGLAMPPVRAAFTLGTGGNAGAFGSTAEEDQIIISKETSGLSEDFNVGGQGRR